MIALRYFQPAPDVRRYLASYYLFRADLPHVTDLVRADLAQIRFMLSGHGRYEFAGGAQVETPAVSLIGPTMAASRFDVTGPVLVFGVGLLPTGWAAAVREDASRLVHHVDDAVSRFGPIMDDALDAMRGATSAETMVSIADVVLRAVFARTVDPPAAFTALTESWLTGDASPSVDQLIRTSGMSARQLERLANRIYGAPPKLLARKYRALRVATALCDVRSNWMDAAGDAFYDQSHLIREVKHFTGLTPRQHRDNPPPVTRLILQRRRFAAQMPRITMVR
ncbi:MAG: putative AraC family transcriptional regulator [Sphingomonas bacterium]|nr:putative AraC family transcriptional regulator [Sphingomonas bacterium]